MGRMGWSALSRASLFVRCLLGGWLFRGVWAEPMQKLSTCLAVNQADRPGRGSSPLPTATAARHGKVRQGSVSSRVPNPPASSLFDARVTTRAVAPVNSRIAGGDRGGYQPVGPSAKALRFPPLT